MANDDLSAADREVMRQLRAGHTKALEAIMDRYHTALSLYADGIVHSSDIADDVLQDVFVRLWENRETLTIHGSLRGYLFGAVRNTALNILQSEQARSRREQAIATESEHNAAIDVTDLDDYRSAVREAVSALPPRCREIFLLVREHDLSYSEVAATLDISLSTVKTQMARAMSSLMERLAPFFVLAVVASTAAYRF